eukprot:5645421-Prymnesium_polylepis.1
MYCERRSVVRVPLCGRPCGNRTAEAAGAAPYMPRGLHMWCWGKGESGSGRPRPTGPNRQKGPRPNGNA